MAEELSQEIEQEQQEPHGEEQQSEIDWKAMARKWERIAKDNKEAAQKLADLEADSETRISNLEERAAKAEQEAADLRKQKEHDQMVSALAIEHEIPADAIRFLKGDSKEELEESISAIKSFIPIAPVIKDSGKPGNPKPQGAEKSQFVKTLFSTE